MEILPVRTTIGRLPEEAGMGWDGLLPGLVHHWSRRTLATREDRSVAQPLTSYEAVTKRPTLIECVSSLLPCRWLKIRMRQPPGLFHP